MSTLKRAESKVEETIVRRSGDPEARADAGRRLASVGLLEDEVRRCQVALRDAERALKLEQNKSSKVQTALQSAQDALSAAQDIIDSNPLPERAQPVGRIQQRDNLKLVSKSQFPLFLYLRGLTHVCLRVQQKVQQLQEAYEAQQRATVLVWDNVRSAEANLFQADKKMNLAVDALKLAEQVIATQARSDYERCVNTFIPLTEGDIASVSCVMLTTRILQYLH
jgi:hypothetical protein